MHANGTVLKMATSFRMSFSLMQQQPPCGSGTSHYRGCTITLTHTR